MKAFLETADICMKAVLETADRGKISGRQLAEESLPLQVFLEKNGKRRLSQRQLTDEACLEEESWQTKAVQEYFLLNYLANILHLITDQQSPSSFPKLRKVFHLGLILLNLSLPSLLGPCWTGRDSRLAWDNKYKNIYLFTVITNKDSPLSLSQPIGTLPYLELVDGSVHLLYACTNRNSPQSLSQPIGTLLPWAG